MDEPIKQIFDAIDLEVSFLHAKWKIFNQLYGDNKDSIELLNEVSPNFFRIIQDTLVDSVIITLSRLTDPSTTRIGENSRENLTFERLLESVDSVKYPTLISNLKKTLESLKISCKEIRIQRNRRIAHLDLKSIIIISEDDILPHVTKNMVEEVLKLCRVFMNDISANYSDSEKAYELVSLNDDGRTMLVHLKKSRAYTKHHLAGILDPVSDKIFHNF